MLPDTELAGAVEIAETMRAAVERRAIPHEGSSLRRVSISAGAATLRPNGDDDARGARCGRRTPRCTKPSSAGAIASQRTDTRHRS